MPTAQQRSFTGGEVGPGFQARVDQARYSTSLKSCRNFIVLRHGGVTNRPGTEFICEHKDPTRKVRLIKFVFNSDQTYVLLFGHEYMRVVQNGVLLESSPGVPYEIATPYQESDLSTLQYTQNADLLTIAHPTYSTRELARTGHTSWTLTIATLTAAVVAPSNVVATQGAAGAIVFDYVVTSIAASTYEESAKSSNAQCTGAIPTETAPNVITWDAYSPAVEFRVYKAVNGVFGYIGTASGTTFKDVNINPDMLARPPITTDPFVGANEKPAVVGSYQQRRLLAGSNALPETVFASRTGLKNNFWRSRPSQSDDSLSFVISSRKVQRVRHLMELDKLIVFTSEGIWAIDGGADGALLPDAINPRLLSSQGADTIPPIMVDYELLYLEDRGTILRSLSTSQNARGKYTGSDLTVLAYHLFEGRRIVAMDYARLPFSVLWGISDDGGLLGLTYMLEHEIWGWHPHDTDPERGLDKFEDVCVVPEGGEDAVYLTVFRGANGTTRRYLERFSTRQFTDQRDACFLDSSLRYDGTNTNPANTLRITRRIFQEEFGWTADGLFDLTSNAALFDAGDIGSQYILYWPATGPNSPEDGPYELKCTVELYSSPTGVAVRVNKDVPLILRETYVATWAHAVKSVSGLDHLNYTNVNVMADGNPIYNDFYYSGPRDVSRAVGQFNITEGQLTLPYHAVKIVVGLPIFAQIETLEIDTVEGEPIITQKKQVGDLAMHLLGSRGLWVGTNEGKKWELKTRRTPGINYGENTPAITGVEEINIQQGWHKSGSVVIRQVDPLPTTILSVIAPFQVGG